jgi:hypothetical protein
VSAGKGGLSCREDQVWAALEEVWVVPEKVWAVRGVAEAVAWEDLLRQGRVANASARPADTGSPMGGVCRARR